MKESLEDKSMEIDRSKDIPIGLCVESSLGLTGMEVHTDIKSDCIDNEDKSFIPLERTEESIDKTVEPSSSCLATLPALDLKSYKENTTMIEEKSDSPIQKYKTDPMNDSNSVAIQESTGDSQCSVIADSESEQNTEKMSQLESATERSRQSTLTCSDIEITSKSPKHLNLVFPIIEEEVEVKQDRIISDFTVSEESHVEPQFSYSNSLNSIQTDGNNVVNDVDVSMIVSLNTF
ncbi:hypothetical protein BC833DRAFT_77019 [Globomyces pollinis-pini]|nr:hypothetical protein BC833DRAFT_77019 [Globomyces pollinis-pini]